MSSLSWNSIRNKPVPAVRPTGPYCSRRGQSAFGAPVADIRKVARVTSSQSTSLVPKKQKPDLVYADKHIAMDSNTNRLFNEQIGKERYYQGIKKPSKRAQSAPRQRAARAASTVGGSSIREADDASILGLSFAPPKEEDQLDPSEITKHLWEVTSRSYGKKLLKDPDADVGKPTHSRAIPGYLGYRPRSAKAAMGHSVDTDNNLMATAMSVATEPEPFPTHTRTGRASMAIDHTAWANLMHRVPRPQTAPLRKMSEAYGEVLTDKDIRKARKVMKERREAFEQGRSLSRSQKPRRSSQELSQMAWRPSNTAYGMHAEDAAPTKTHKPQDERNTITGTLNERVVNSKEARDNFDKLGKKYVDKVGGGGAPSVSGSSISDRSLPSTLLSSRSVTSTAPSTEASQFRSYAEWYHAQTGKPKTIVKNSVPQFAEVEYRATRGRKINPRTQHIFFAQGHVRQHQNQPSLGNTLWRPIR